MAPTLLQKLHKIQCSVRGLGKDSTGGAGVSSYGFVSGSKVLEVVRPQMDELGVLLIPNVDSIESERIDYLVKSGPKSEMLTKVMITFIWIDVESGERLCVPFGANGMNGWDKGLGSALTYAERYFLLKFFHIATDEDDVDKLPPKADAPVPPAVPVPPASPAKREMSDMQLKKTIGRINAGELDLLDKCRESFELKGWQLHAMNEAVMNYKVNNNIK